ncbi:efflux RND transporter periplasmic adaptor subunit [Brevibacillus humidisoli]|uniref:efflux RND transporter periplasmic adaptor subunit n=1 Tax=Brevibacillus humidisoli TaxID=2895522 RepID=UPI001E41279A|nr:efflux RND transporter periplasmic adaptor subunit [Brevibacillus humidisoli]UFJ43269.1 efflux RND transporter periplasmic adaptor subunit [Brevibacillus humidisoli]
MTKLVLTVTLLTMTGCSADGAVGSEPAEEKAKIVAGLTVTKQTEAPPIIKTGIVEPVRDLYLSFGTGGKVVELHVEKGSEVNQGDLLAAIDSSAYQQAAAAAQAAIQEASARRHKTLQGADAEAIAQQRLSLEGAKQRLEQADKAFQQAETLYEAGAISESERDAARHSLTQAELTWRNEQLALDQLLQGAEQDEIVSADASLAQAASQAAQARQSLQDTRLIAPFAGTVVDVAKQIGEMSSPGQNVLHLVDLREMKVTLDIPSTDIRHYKSGADVTVTNDSGLSSTGTISFVSPVADEATGKYRVEVKIPNNDKAWRGGMMANISVPRQLQSGLIIPLQTVGINQSQHYVLLVENGVTVKRTVEVGQVIGEQIEVLSGLRPGETIVLNGIGSLVEGEKVAVKGE